MGFFSWDCRDCGHPMLSSWATNETNGWMQDVAVIQSDGARLRGLYDGYGRVISHFSPNTLIEICNPILHPGYGDPECWHAACWGLAGEPTTYTEGSEMSEDQGYFFGDEHNIERPR